MSADDLDQLTDADLSHAFAREYLGCTCDVLIRFSTSADAVLPHLDGWQWEARNGRSWGSGMHMVKIEREGDGHFIAHAYARTFPRAACIALIRAKRATKGQL